MDGAHERLYVLGEQGLCQGRGCFGAAGAAGRAGLLSACALMAACRQTWHILWPLRDGMQKNPT